MEEVTDLERLLAAIEELMAVTTEGRLATLFQLLAGSIIMKGSDAVVELLRETATYTAPDGMATIVIARDMAPPPVEGETRDWRKHVQPGDRQCEFCFNTIPAGQVVWYRHDNRGFLTAIACGECFTLLTVDQRPPVEVGHGETPPEGYEANVAANVAWLQTPTPAPHFELYNGANRLLCHCGKPATQATYLGASATGYCGAHSPVKFHP